jgi:hypothetical protein
MPNPFDQFDAPMRTNPFDQFDQSTPQSSVTLGGLGKAVDVGLARGISGLVGAPGVIANLGASGIEAAQKALNNVFGSSEKSVIAPALRTMASKLPTSEQSLANIQKTHYGGGAPYEPQNMAERLAATVGEFAPGAALPGGFVTRAANVALPAGATFAAQEAGAPPIVQAGAALLGGVGASKLGNIAERASAIALPTLGEAKSAAQTAYNQIEQIATLAPHGAADRAVMVADIKNTLHGANMRPAKVPDIHAEIDNLPHAGDAADLITLRRNLKNLRGADGVAANSVLPKVEAEIERLMPGAVKDLQTADQNYNAFKVAEGLDKRLAKATDQTGATHSGLNIGNKLRQAAASIANDERRTKYMRPEEIQALRDVAGGTFTQNSLRYLSNLLGGGGGLGALAGGAVGYEAGGPEGALMGALGGLATRGAFGLSVGNQARGISSQVMARSPLAMQMGAHYIPQQTLLGALRGGGILGGLPLTLPQAK